MIFKVQLTETEAIVEALLFVHGNQIEIEKISLAIDKGVEETEILLQGLIEKYENEKRGMQIIKINNSYQMTTNAKYFAYIEKAFNNKSKKMLSQTLVETLAIVAYKQPITKAQIEDIRGVNTVHAINKLIEYNLICEKGRLNAVGKPILFGTTDEFLKYFGFDSIDNLPEVLTVKE